MALFANNPLHVISRLGTALGCSRFASKRANRGQSKPLKIAEGDKEQIPRVNIILTLLANITLSRNVAFEKLYWNK